MDGQYWADLIRPQYDGVRFVVVADLLASALPQVEFLLEQGAQRPFVIAAGRGVGEVPTETQAEIALLDLDLPAEAGSRFMPFLRGIEAATSDLDPKLLDRIDAWDPEGEALVLSPHLLGGRPIGPRSPYGSRKEAWIALENKMSVDQLWDDAAVRRAPARILGVESDELAAASVDLDWGHGTVWVGDNREGWHGGAEYLRWVRDPRGAASAYRFFRAHCDEVRVMPFLEGVPCSIHGMVFDDAVIAVRPIEMIVLAVEGGNELKYLGTGSFWDPPEADRSEMRGIARRVGHLLATAVSFRGIFTVDGVMTRAGFLPTELNPRFGAGLGRAVRGIEGLPLLGVQRALIEGLQLDYRPADLETLLVDHADGQRNASAFYQVPELPESEIEVFLDIADGRVAVVDDEASGNVALKWGEGTVSGAVVVRLNVDRVPTGTSATPLVAEALGYARRNWPVTMPVLTTIGDVL
jgi:hypothetical protein